MPFDGIAMYAVAQELISSVIGSRITKIFQPRKDEIIISLRNLKDEMKLLISVNPDNCRIHLTDIVAENPATPPMFCMLLRKYLTGGRIKNICQKSLERLMEISIESTNEFMQPVELNLIVEIMGKHSNIILKTSDDNIIDSIKRITFEVNRFRQVLPGEKYVFPPMGGKLNLLCIDDNIIMSTLLDSKKESPQTPISKWILEHIAGINGTTAREIINRAGVDENKSMGLLTPPEFNNILEILSDLRAHIKNFSFYPEVYFDEDTQEPLDFWVFPMARYKNNPKKEIAGVNKAVDFFYSRLTEVSTLVSLKTQLKNEVSKYLKKINEKIFHIKQAIKKTDDMEKYRLWGEILSANLYRLKPGLKEVRLANFYTPGKEITIPLNEKYTPAQNAQIYFNRYKKLQATRHISKIRMDEALMEVDYLENILINIQNSNTLEDINDIYQELIAQGYIKAAKKRGKIEKSNSRPLMFKSFDGFNIYVGKNNHQNDILTLKKAHPDDIWLHTKNIPGSHVIIECLGKDVPPRTLHEAAILAAYFSKARSGSNVPVDYTLRKYVRKPSGAKPGFVIYDHQKTLYVTPDSAMIKKLDPSSVDNLPDENPG